jgi:HlyD family secretion protein
MSRILIRRWLIAFVVLVLIALALWWANRPKPIAVVLQEIDRGKVELTVANTRAGEVKACMRTRLSPILGGRIEIMGVKEGDHVKKGQLLIKLWNDDQKAQYRLAQTQVESVRKHVTEACVLATSAMRDAERQAALRAKGFVSSSAEEVARAAADSKRASCEAVKADVAQANARVAAIQVEQGRTVLFAPFDGIVAKIVGEVGEYSTPSPPGVPTPPAIDLIDDSCLYVSAPLDEVDAPKIRAGQVVRISLDALPKQSFPGKVRRVAPYVSAIEKQARTVDLEATFDKPEATGKLLVGYSANVEVILAVRENVVRVPTSALQEGGRVLVAGADGTLQARTLKTGVANWDYTEVLSGLAPGEKVVTSPEREGVRAGAAYVAEAKPTP